MQRCMGQLMLLPKYLDSLYPCISVPEYNHLIHPFILHLRPTIIHQMTPFFSHLPQPQLPAPPPLQSGDNPSERQKDVSQPLSVGAARGNSEVGRMGIAVFHRKGRWPMAVMLYVP